MVPMVVVMMVVMMMMVMVMILSDNHWPLVARSAGEPPLVLSP